MKKYKNSLVIGKFYPFHKGHKYLIETAVKHSENVFVVITQTDLYHIPVEVRKGWIEEVFPDVKVHVLYHDPAMDNPSPSKSQRWAAKTIEILGFKPDAVFCSEDYGAAYASYMGAANEVVDKSRVAFPISGTKARKDPYAQDVWDLLTEPVKKYYENLKNAHPREKVKIALAQMKVVPGQPDKNIEKMTAEIEEARSRDIDIIVFPEMAVPGYFLGDEWENEALIKDLMKYNEDLRELSDNITIIWGNVFADFEKVNEDGRTRKYNAIFIAQNKKWVSNGVFEGRSYKTLMPKYRMFDDERHFYSMLKLAHEKNTNLAELLKPFQIEVRGEKVNIGLSLCEDMWQDDYNDKPIEILIENGADLIINISCSPWTWRKNQKRHKVVEALLKRYPIPFIYCNNVGIQNNGKDIFMFDGNSTVYNQNGSVLLEVDFYKESTVHFTLFDSKRNLAAPNIFDTDSTELFTSLVYGIREFFKSVYAEKAIIGISGGIDSAVSAALLVEALGPSNVFGVNMPSKYNSNLTKNAAAKLAENLGINYAIVEIQTSVNLTVQQLLNVKFTGASAAVVEIKVSDLVMQNIQARDRSARVLAALASALGGVFVSNGNKTETALGYATLYGDVAGAIAPIADLYKREIYQLAGHINKIKGKDLIPQEIINIVPSAELNSSQDVTKGLGDPIKYEYHDELIRALIEFRYDPEKILQMYIAGNLEEALHLKKDTIKKYFKTHQEFINDLEEKWRLIKINYFKRIQAPPILVTSRRAFGFDLRESQNGFYLTREYKNLKAWLLR